jgi:hypothetical protein
LTALARPAPRVDRSVAWQGTALVVAALALAALSLLRPYALAFDPMAWNVWGREVGRLTLDTSSGPSWKPFPVLFTTPLALFGSAAPSLWLIVARAGGLLALAGAFALATRLGGRWAGAAAVAVMALSPWWAFNTALGNSEGLLAAAVLWAVIAHLSGRRRTALALLTAAALMRPEAWPFLGAYGVWLWRRNPADRLAVVLAGLSIPLLWFGPDILGAGGALDASKTARGVPSPGSAKLASVPALAVLGDAATLFTLPALAAAVVAAFFAGHITRLVAASAAAWVAIVAVMTVAGYAGNPRYLVAAAALGAALAGVGAVRAATALAELAARRRATGEPRSAAAGEPPHGTAGGRSAREPPRGAAGRRSAGEPPHGAAGDTARRLAAPLGAAVLVAAVLALTLGDLRDQSSELSARAEASGAFAGVLAAGGGRDALVGCSRIRTSNRARSLVAWRLDLPLRDLDARPERPAVVIRAKWFYGQGLEPPVPPGFRTLATRPYWQIVAACGRAPQQGT